MNPSLPKSAHTPLAAASLYDYLLLRQERHRWADRLGWPLGLALLVLGVILELTVF